MADNLNKQFESNAAAWLQTRMQEAVAAQQRGEFALAEQCYREVLRYAPTHADATHFLGLLAHQTGHDDVALPLLERAIQLGPQSYLYRHNLACVFQALGRHAEAEQCSLKTLARKPDYSDALFVLAKSQAAQNHDRDALTSYQRALALDPGHFDAMLGLSEVLLRRVRRAEALTSLRRARALAAGDVAKLLRAAAALQSAEAYVEARGCFEEVLAISPDCGRAYVGLGVTLANLGDMRGAEAHYREALRLKPDNAGAYYNLASQIRLKPEDPLWSPLLSLVESAPSRSTDEQILLQFAAGKVWEDAHEYDRAFPHFLEGNRLKRSATNYDESRQAAFYHEAIRWFDPEFLAAHAQAGVDADSPIFVVGMSRSGTTLIEQILASHPSVHGAGEMRLLQQSVHVELKSSASDDELPQRIAQLDDAALQSVGARYLAGTRDLAPAAARIVDKLQGNMVLLGLIHVVFPRARIIHCRRDPLDTCVSCFTRHFTTGHDFSYDLGELGRFYRLYEELMQHWSRVLPATRILEVRYENVVNDFEAQARRLIEFCGLEWNDACLHFYETRRPVRTASLTQVRQPIYASSVGRWKRYEKYLAPLQAALEGARPKQAAEAE